ncbi:hypothetical protein HPB47_002870, partial [Ixodes persulcatus]
AKRGLTISRERSAILAFTKKKVEKYPICAQGVTIPYVKQHISLGMTLDRSLTQTPHIKRLKKKSPVFVNVVKCMCSTRWGTSVSSLPDLYNARRGEGGGGGGSVA